MDDLDGRLADVQEYFHDRGFRLRVEMRDRTEELRKSGYHGIASEHYTHWVDVVSIKNPDFVVPYYAAGRSEADAIIRARARWGSEQG